MRAAPTGAPPSPSLWLIVLRVYRDRETDRNIPFSVLPSHLVAPTKRLHPTHISGIYNKTVSPPRSHTVCEGDAWNTSEVIRPSVFLWRSINSTSSLENPFVVGADHPVLPPGLLLA